MKKVAAHKVKLQIAEKLGMELNMKYGRKNQKDIQTEGEYVDNF